MSDAIRAKLDKLYPDYLGARVKEKNGVIFVYLDNKRHDRHRWTVVNGELHMLHS